jgi:isopenicillin-N N-acyltransferase-like protein
MIMRATVGFIIGLVSLLPARRLLAVEDAKPQAAEARTSSATTSSPQPMEVLTSALTRWGEIVQPPQGQARRTFVTRIKVVKAQGLPRAVADLSADVAFQAPDRLRVSAMVGGRDYSVGRDGQQLWVDIPHKNFALLGKNGVPRFKTHPEELDSTRLPPLESPIEPGAAALALAWGTQIKLDKAAEQQAAGVKVLHFARKQNGSDAEARLWLRESDLLPLRAAYRAGTKIDVEVEFENPRLEEPWAAEKWAIAPGDGTKVETVALAHLVRFLEVAPDALFNNHVPSLGPVTGERRTVAREGEGRLEMHDGTRVLFLKGSPAEMGRQHGRLLKKEILHTMDRILYGVGVGSSFDRGNWFFGEIESAQARVEPYCDQRYLDEIDAIAAAVGAHRQEGRLANFFPELFHCSGFSIFGKATQGGRMYHGRILDYMTGVGLEQNAVVIVHQPDGGRHAWVNVTYAGFVGTVTAMNEKGISIGEMGGGGYGKWDGKPMAQLLREVMEKADTLEEAVAILRDSPRTCEYYYVVSDGKSKQAVGVAATPDTFETVAPGQSHPRLPHGVEDAVLLSAGDRYEELVRRVRSNYGKLDVAGSRDLMTRPVCMTSNIHSVLFAPETLDFWVANADSKNVASHTRYTHYNLTDLLKPEGTASAGPSAIRP